MQIDLYKYDLRQHSIEPQRGKGRRDISRRAGIPIKPSNREEEGFLKSAGLVKSLP